MVFKDYYKILNLETNKVSLEEIKIAYRSAAKKYHPDVNVGDRLAEDRIKDINEAYKVLSDISAKRKYDRIWNANIGKQKDDRRINDSVFGNFFHMFFGDVDEKDQTENKKVKGKDPIKGENIQTEVKISIEEGFYGLSKRISLRTVDGTIKTFDVTIPAGIRDGEKIRLIGQGKEGINGGKRGDLLIKVVIEDNKIFKLNGYDIYTDLLISPWEAALGTRLQVNSIDDSSQIFIPKGIQTGEILKIPGKGYKTGDGKRGNLIAEVKIMMPKNLTEEEVVIFEKLNKISKFNPRNEKQFT